MTTTSTTILVTVDAATKKQYISGSSNFSKRIRNYPNQRRQSDRRFSPAIFRIRPHLCLILYSNSLFTPIVFRQVVPVPAVLRSKSPVVRLQRQRTVRHLVLGISQMPFGVCNAVQCNALRKAVDLGPAPESADQCKQTSQ